MVPKDQIKVGDEVLMGRPNGQKARCRVKRVSQKTCTVNLIEQYGTGRSSVPGSQWRVPFSLLWPAEGSLAVERPEEKVGPQWDGAQPLSVDQLPVDGLILKAIGQLYAMLSPENLSCDGELPIAEVRRREREYRRKLELLQQALGRSVSETQYFQWVEKIAN